MTMNAAFEVKPKWWKDEALARRRAAVRALANDVCPGGGLAEREVRVRAVVNNYWTTRWRFDQTRDVMPEKYAGKRDELLFTILHESSRLAGNGELTTVPLSPTYLREMLSDCSK
jgi:hypothetical protein